MVAKIDWGRVEVMIYVAVTLDVGCPSSRARTRWGCRYTSLGARRGLARTPISAFGAHGSFPQGAGAIAERPRNTSNVPRRS